MEGAPVSVGGGEAEGEAGFSGRPGAPVEPPDPPDPPDLVPAAPDPAPVFPSSFVLSRFACRFRALPWEARAAGTGPGRSVRSPGNGERHRSHWLGPGRFQGLRPGGGNHFTS